MMVLTFMIQSAVSCIRFEHMQRSRMIASHDRYIEFECRQGKARRKGARPAYRWATPEVEFQGWSLCSTLRDFFGHECLPDATFLWPALQLSATELWELTDVTPFDASKPMSRSRFLELLRGAIGEMGTPQEDAACAGYNRLRRFMPTLGNCLRFPRTEMQAIGSWVEIPCGGGRQATKKEKAVMDMGFHYAGHKVVQSAQIKIAILHRFFRLYRLKVPELALSGTGQMKFDAWTWSELCSMGDVLDIPQFEVPAAELAAPMPVEDEQPPAVPVRHVDPVDSSDSEGVGQEHVEKVVSSGSEDEDSSSSASDVSAVAEELVGVILPSGWECVSTSSDIPEFRFMGPKPVPGKVSWEQGFAPIFNPSDVVAAKGKGAMHTFTREFRHPTDRVRQVTPAAAAARFESDDRRFPPGAYEERCLVWHGESWRTPSPNERCELMGLPPDLLSPVAGSQARRTQARNSLVGNGFHIPSIILLLCLIPQVLEAKICTSLPPADESALRSRLRGTVWEPGTIEVFPGLLDADQVVQALQAQFLEYSIPSPLLDQTRHRLQTCKLSWMQYFTAWSRQRGDEWECLGPTLVLPRDRSALFASLGGQRYASDSKRGLDHALPPGLGKHRHMEEAQLLPNPFSARPWPEKDVQFVIQFVIAIENSILHSLNDAKQFLRPLLQLSARWKSGWPSTDHLQLDW